MQQISMDVWLSSLADRTPTPGGGGAAALAAATAAALVGMVTGYTTGDKWHDREARMQTLNSEAAALRGQALELVDADAAAFGAVSAAYRLPRNTDAERAARSTAIQQALLLAAGPPASTGQLAARVIEVAAELVDTGNPNVVSDVAVAAAMARAAVEAAIVNIEINRAQIRDQVAAQELAETVKDLGAKADAAGDVIHRVSEKLAR